MKNRFPHPKISVPNECIDFLSKWAAAAGSEARDAFLPGTTKNFLTFILVADMAKSAQNVVEIRLNNKASDDEGGIAVTFDLQPK